ncbi:1-acyl-sn-glycerol-3-phosphate acyltransferase [Actinomadura parmotrematis]|uniref:1-acyl-sn-glycerol-3-phosphate acyltransferase n=1 Tax=Actinomadura parmotrematis TaxID=2864039 RepID=A0ABS7G2B7_9ACTN|nr:1-acyl-sn-glycerol-3-phosphate acyltransferase [Actinomadura parmotrematis]MBW8486861.1 1-acyl-sn-glycerol-3-phosphate acyltransferase [Actinomadura parmotrematis]
MMPPPVIRRLVFVPLLFVLTLLVLALFPVVFPAAALASRVRNGRRRAIRLLAFAVAWGTLETRAVLECALLWCRAPFHVKTPRLQDAHYAVIRRYVAGLYGAAERHLGLRIEQTGTVVPDPEAPGATAADRPVIVLSRHAGPGDALLLVHSLLTEYRRRPRVVMKAFLQYDPCIDIAGNRLPNVWVRPGDGAAERIELAARGLGERAAVVIFPEGGNFTPTRRRRAIVRLLRQRRPREAVRGAGMENVMAPRASGVIAALTAAPDADVVFVAHSGLEAMATARDVWRDVPLERTVRAHWWRIPAAEIPAGREERIDWLFTQWERVDAWIGACASGDEATRLSLQ